MIYIATNHSKADKLAMPMATDLYTIGESFDDWESRGYEDSIPGVVTKTAPSGDGTA